MACKRVLIVEDEMMVAMLVEDMVIELGHEVVGIVARIDEAMRLLDSLAFDVAILDVHLNGQLVFPLADALAARKIPYMFATGYGARGIPHAHAWRPILQKPFQVSELERYLNAILA